MSILCLLRILVATGALGVAGTTEPLKDARLEAAAERVVKIYGAGGLGRIEAYQTGIVVSPSGHILTANSLVLDQGHVTVVVAGGDRYSGEVIGADPIADVAVLRIDPAGAELPAYRLSDAATAEPGDRVYALANVFGIATGNEPVTLQRGVVAAVAPLRAQRGPLSRVNGGDVLIVDAVTSNPGAAGGALVDHNGRLIGMLGRELKSRVTGAWLSYALPASELRTIVERIVQGHAVAAEEPDETDPANVDLLSLFGFVLTPNVVPRTPPYVDHVERGSAAYRAGLKPDDLIVTVDGLVTGSATEVRRVASRRSRGSAIELVVQRGDEFVDIRLDAVRSQPEGAP